MIILPSKQIGVQITEQALTQFSLGAIACGQDLKFTITDFRGDIVFVTQSV